MASGDSPVIPGQLGIHVLSGKIGESTIVTLPDGKWFVVDAYKGGLPGRDEPHAVLSFLKQFGFAAQDCLFVLLSHLHDDHYSGIPTLLTRLRQVHSQLKLARHAAYRVGAVVREVEEVLTKKERRSGGLLRIGSRAKNVTQLFSKGCLDVSQWWQLYRDQAADCSVVVITPGETIVHEYCWGGAVSQMAAGLDKDDEILNDMSIALCIAFGDVCMVLAGDCEKRSWSCLDQDPSPPYGMTNLGNALERVRLIKAPHHGSSRAWNDTLARYYGRCQYAISTHNWRGRYNLPDAQGIENVLQQGVTLALPNRDFLTEAVPDSYCTTATPITRIRVPLELVDHEPDRKNELEDSYPFSKIRAEPTGKEVHWVSVSFSPDGSSAGWYGGSGAVFLRYQGI